MRVRSSFSAPLTLADGCQTNLAFGEIEDYDLAIFCPNNLAVNANPIPNGIYAAEIELTSSGTVENGFDVTFQAGNAMELQAGFEVKLGGVLEILMQGCFP